MYLNIKQRILEREVRSFSLFDNLAEIMLPVRTYELRFSLENLMASPGHMGHTGGGQMTKLESGHL